MTSSPTWRCSPVRSVRPTYYSAGRYIPHETAKIARYFARESSPRVTRKGSAEGHWPYYRVIGRVAEISKSSALSFRFTDFPNVTASLSSERILGYLSALFAALATLL